MRFILGFLLGYSIRGNKRLLAALTTIAVVCFIVLPASRVDIVTTQPATWQCAL